MDMREELKTEGKTLVKNGETEITINGKVISVSTSNVLVTVVSDKDSTSVTSFVKGMIVSQIL